MSSRAERRRRTRNEEKSQAVYTLTQAQIDSLKKEMSENATERAIVIMLGFPLVALRHGEGYGKVRLQRVLKDTMDIYYSYADKDVTLKELHKMIEDGTGLNIVSYVEQLKTMDKEAGK